MSDLFFIGKIIPGYSGDAQSTLGLFMHLFTPFPESAQSQARALFVGLMETRCKSGILYVLADEVLHLRQLHLPRPVADEMTRMRRDESLTQLNIAQTLKT